MTNERFQALMDNDDLPLTQAEQDQGWHFCDEFDGLLRNNAEDMAESSDAFQCDCMKGNCYL